MSTPKPVKASKLVIQAIQQLKTERGFTPREIIKFISANHGINDQMINCVYTALKRGTEYGFLQSKRGRFALKLAETIPNIDLKRRQEPEDDADLYLRVACGCHKGMRKRSRKSRRHSERRSHCRSRSRSKGRRRSRRRSHSHRRKRSLCKRRGSSRRRRSRSHRRKRSLCKRRGSSRRRRSHSHRRKKSLCKRRGSSRRRRSHSHRRKKSLCKRRGSSLRRRSRSRRHRKSLCKPRGSSRRRRQSRRRSGKSRHRRGKKCGTVEGAATTPQGMGLASTKGEKGLAAPKASTKGEGAD